MKKSYLIFSFVVAFFSFIVYAYIRTGKELADFGKLLYKTGVGFDLTEKRHEAF